MADEPSKRRSEADAELEREIRNERKFSLAEAIGRMAGPGMMKGVSPITRKQQADAEIEAYLSQHLRDAAGVLPGLLLRSVKESERLLNNLNQPLVVLAGHVRQVLDSEYLLKELVREADVELGRIFGERPHFEKEGCPPHPDDRYSLASVRAALSELVEGLTAGDPARAVDTDGA